MVEALKKLDKKFLILLGCIILLPIVLIIFLAIIQGCSNSKMTYDAYQNKMISAAKRYFKGSEPEEEGEYVTVNLSTLIDKGYIKTSKKVLDDECSGSVTVRMNGSSIESNNGGYLNYTVKLNCENFNTETLADKLISNVVTEGSGLFKVNDEYIFKGDSPNNYIKFFDKSYRIMGIDKDGIIKLINAEQDESYRIWDNKYNSDTNKNSGKTIYKDSAILKQLLTIYESDRKISKSAKEHIVAYDVCIGKRSKNNYSIDRDLDCSETLNGQLISLLNVSDFALASTDPECVSTKSKSCRNYNYLYSLAGYSWTLNSVSEDTYNVFYYVGGLQEYKEASSSERYNYVIYIDGNELYQKGEGTKINPYIIK